MVFTDKYTAVLKDTSIARIYDSGRVELFPSKKWKKVPKAILKQHKNFYTFNFETYEGAINILNELEKMM